MTAEKLASMVLATCDVGRFLHVGCGNGGLVRHLLKLGCDAYGFDESGGSTAEAEALVPSRFRSGSLANLPYDGASFDTVIVGECVAELDDEHVAGVLRDLYRITRLNVVACLALGSQDGGSAVRRDRTWWEHRFFAAGFRKHPSYYTVNPYEGLERDGQQIIVLMEKTPADATKSYPVDALSAERDLHMDMLRESGRRSDAHIMRYVLAAGLVRRGDTVLDAACGMGYGSHLLRRNTRAAKVIGVDIARNAIDYARANFGLRRRDVEFRLADVENLSVLPDHSIDLVASFETLEHILHPKRFLAEVRRVLRPGGRIIVSVPNRWVDASGTDPNPYHLHVYDWEMLCAQLKDCFLVEKAYQQIAGNGFVLSDRPRRLREVSVKTVPQVESEWWIMVGSVDPTCGTTTPYEEVFYSYSEPPENLLAFARDYQNPWLVRSMVEYPTRALSGEVLAHVAKKVLQGSSPGSCDQGAGLCVLGYRLLEDDAASRGDVEWLVDQIQDYVSMVPTMSHQLRWRISLAFLRAQLLLKQGRFQQAEQAFAGCASMDCAPFSPTLGTKTVAAFFMAGWLAHNRGDTTSARDYWKSGIREAKRLLKCDWVEFLGLEENPLLFPLVDAVEFLDAAVMCANALRCTSGDSNHPVANMWTEVNYCWKTMINDRWRAIQDMEVIIRDRDDVISAQARMIEERWQVMQEMGGVLRRRDGTIAEQTRVLDDRWAAMQRMESMIRDRDKTISEQARMVEDRWAAMQRMESMIRDRDKTISEQACMVEDRWAAMQKMESMIRDGDGTIAEHTRVLDDRWAAMQKMESMIRDRDGTIAEQTRVLDDRWAAMQKMESMIRDRDAAMAAQADMLDKRWDMMQQMEAVICDRNNTIAALNEELDDRRE